MRAQPRCQLQSEQSPGAGAAVSLGWILEKLGGCGWALRALGELGGSKPLTGEVVGPWGCLLGRSLWGGHGLPGVVSPNMYVPGSLASHVDTLGVDYNFSIPKFLQALNASWGNFGHGE